MTFIEASYLCYLLKYQYPNLQLRIAWLFFVLLPFPLLLSLPIKWSFFSETLEPLVYHTTCMVSGKALTSFPSFLADPVYFTNTGFASRIFIKRRDKDN